MLTTISQRLAFLLDRILETPIYRSAAYVLAVSVLYLPKGVVGVPLPTRAWACLGAMLSLGALGLYSLSMLSRIREWLSRYSLRLMLLVTVLVTASLTAYLIFAFHRFVPWVDAAKFAQSLWRVLQGEGFEPVLGREFAPPTHVSPTLLLLLPVYALWPSVLTLVIVRTMLVAASSVVLYVLASRYLKRDIAMLLALAYLFNFSIVYQMVSGFTETQLFPVLFFLAWWCLERQHFAGWIGALFLIGGIREEMGAVLIGCAAFASLRSWPRRYWLSAALLGIAWLVVSYGLILGVGEGRYQFYYVFAKTNDVVSRIFTWDNGVFLYHVMLPFGFVLPFLGWSFLPVAPILAGCLYANYQIAKVAFLHYSLPVVVGFYYAASRHLSSIGSRIAQRHGDLLAAMLVLLMFTLSLTQTVEHFFYELSFHPPTGGVLGLTIDANSSVLRDHRAFERWMTSLREVVKKIPPGSRASVPSHVVAHVPHQPPPLDYEFERVGSLPDYVVVDENIMYPSGNLAQLRASKAVLNQRYRVRYRENGVVLYSLIDCPTC